MEILGKFCVECGEYIPHPVWNLNMCHDCSRADMKKIPDPRRITRPAELTDMQYHGSLYYRGEF